MPVPLGFCGVTVGLPDTMTHSDVPLRGIIALMVYFNYFLGGLRGFLYRANDLENEGFNIHNAGVGGRDVGPSSPPVATNFMACAKRKHEGRQPIREAKWREPVFPLATLCAPTVPNSRPKVRPS